MFFITLLYLEHCGDGIYSVNIFGVVWDQFYFSEKVDILNTENFGSFPVLRCGGGKVFAGMHGKKKGRQLLIDQQRGYCRLTYSQRVFG